MDHQVTGTPFKWRKGTMVWLLFNGYNKWPRYLTICEVGKKAWKEYVSYIAKKKETSCSCLCSKYHASSESIQTTDVLWQVLLWFQVT